MSEAREPGPAGSEDRAGPAGSEAREAGLSKSEARRLGRERRRLLDRALRAAFDKTIQERLCAFVRERGAFDIIMSYVSAPEEVDTLGFMWRCGRVAVPRVEGDEISFYEVGSPADLEEGYRGIAEPGRHCSGAVIRDERRALIIVPGLAFTRDGRRVGYGGGYFDRYLAAHPALTKVGLAYEAQLLDDFETEPTDIPMDFVITERGLYA